MNRILLSTAAVLVIAVSFLSSPPRALRWRTAQYENVLGTSMQIKLRAASDEAAARAEAAAMAEIKRLNGILSGYDSSSEFSRWARTRNQAVQVSPELMEVLSLWSSWRARSGDVLNPASEAIAQVWKHAAAPPSALQLTPAVNAAHQQHWQLQPAGGLATRLGDAPLMLNSFTKSYIVERAADAAMRSPGVTGVVLNIGGDLVVRGPLSDHVNITDPRSDSENSAPIAVLNVNNRAVATSGSYRRGFDIAGRHYSHIIDPRTGRTAEHIISATVVAPHAVDAGALATAFCILSPDESRTLAASIAGVEYMLIRNDGERIVSLGWNALVEQEPTVWSLPQAKAAPDNYELTVNVEIPQAQGFGARRPYVAVWIEDKDRFPIRTLALWFNNTRWLSDLRGWYRSDRLRAVAEGTEIAHSVSSATRSPGKYSFKWDGKDSAGKLVKPGRYTVLVEAAREHGGYNLVRHQLDLAGVPAQAQVPANGELGAVSIDYHKAN